MQHDRMLVVWTIGGEKGQGTHDNQPDQDESQDGRRVPSQESQSLYYSLLALHRSVSQKSALALSVLPVALAFSRDESVD